MTDPQQPQGQAISREEVEGVLLRLLEPFDPELYEPIAAAIAALPPIQSEVEGLRAACRTADEHITTMLTAIAGGDAEAGRRFADKDPTIQILRRARHTKEQSNG